jgi:predicted DNA-binding transcriptional regulator AlpA
LGKKVKMNGDEKNGENALSLAAPVPPVNSEKRWLRYREVAERVGVCERTIRRDVDAGNLPKPVKMRGCLIFDWPEVDAALKARKGS